MSHYDKDGRHYHEDGSFSLEWIDKLFSPTPRAGQKEDESSPSPLLRVVKNLNDLDEPEGYQVTSYMEADGSYYSHSDSSLLYMEFFESDYFRNYFDTKASACEAIDKFLKSRNQ